MKIKGLFIVMIAGALACLLLTGYKNGKVAANGKLTWQEKDGKWGMVDKNGKVVVPYEYDYIDEYTLMNVYPSLENQDDDFLLMVGKGEREDEHQLKEGAKYGYVNMRGEEVIPLEYDWMYGWFGEDGCSVVEKNGKWGAIDKKGNIVVPIEYDDFIHSDGYGWSIFSEDGFAVVVKDGKKGLVDKNGKEIIPCEYESVSHGFSEGMAAVGIGGEFDDEGFYIDGGKWGFVDETGKLVIPLIYDDVTSFKDGKAYVKKDGKEGYINKKGEFTEGKAEQTNTIDDNPNW